jgi:endonuclease/exonuclease/phosphatase family metal-dependent hydrolase
VNYRCDRNVRHSRFPWRSFNRLRPRVKSNWQWHEEAGRSLPQSGTHKPDEGGRRLIDYVFAKEHPAVSYGSSQIWVNRLFGSDHAPVRATYRLARD